MEALGIDLKLLIAQVINFVILLFLLKKFLYKPVVNMLEERKSKVEQGLKDSEEAKKSLEKAEAKSEEIEGKAYGDANEILKNAKAEASSEAAGIVKKATEQADRIMGSAKAEAALAKGKALTEARKEMGTLLSLSLDKVIGEGLDQTEREKLTTRAIEEL